ncbi:ThuA domain-containing protein [Parapedobacter sp. ISTM3]|uniref:ThuA domain-containing protein n=1 Tax=Parapedobacter sp. ISTM3 TaxID=2800130 RepID=UPI00190638E6|nr:ThuA domain-containing protein [Parapedobacter sp. ISTM3]MBK1440123.1 ThuA domain-containing protein [Parapedobacter sp. ISTM3]
MKKTNRAWSSLLLLVALMGFIRCSAGERPEISEDQWITYTGYEGPGAGKHIVLISGDEEYRSEEALPMLAQILAKKFGFTCTVLFSIDPSTGEIDANQQANIPGLANLESADLMVIFTRFRELPPDQMRHIDDYLKAGKPVVGLRTATHAFHYAKKPDDPFARYDFQSTVSGWEGGFGKLVLGETWISHHGDHGKEGTRGVVNEENAASPILNGVQDIWGPTDVYTVGRLAGADILMYGQSTSGMTADAPVNRDKPALPVAWTKRYKLPDGKSGKAFTTTMGASVDLLNEDLRRLLVNACFWAVGLENQIPEKADVAFVTPYQPTMFGFDSFIKGKRPADYRLQED